MTTQAQRHARCAAHMPHPYPSNGKLCLSEDTPEHRADMVAFADHLARVAADHRSREQARPIGNGQQTDPIILTNVKTGETSIKPMNDAWTGHAAAPAIQDREGMYRLARELDRIKGRDRTPSPVKAPKPARVKASRPVKNAPGRTHRPEPTQVPVAVVLSRHNRRDRGGQCERCGQTFRFETGRAWHMQNRPDCKAQSVRRAMAS